MTMTAAGVVVAKGPDVAVAASAAPVAPAPLPRRVNIAGGAFTQMPSIVATPMTAPRIPTGR